MHKLVPALLLLAFAGCKHSGSQKLEGRWRGQKADGVAEGTASAANLFAAGSEIIAQGNQIAIYTPASKPPPATYVVEQEDAKTVVIHTDRDGTRETFNFNDKADMLTWQVDATRTITFKKVR